MRSPRIHRPRPSTGRPIRGQGGDRPLGRAMLVAWAVVAAIAATGCGRPPAGGRTSLDVLLLLTAVHGTSFDGTVYHLSAEHRGTALSAAAALRLAERPHGVALRRLESLDESAAAALARHRGLLALNGVRSLDVSAVRCLAAHDGPVCLHGLGDVGAETAALLAASPTRYFTGPIAPARDR